MSEALAHQLVQRGSDVLRERMRRALTDAGADEDELETLVQRAVAGADEVQWRGALAACAADELDLGLGEALRHPAVALALELVGAAPADDAQEPSLELEAEHLEGVPTLRRGEHVKLRLTATELQLRHADGELVGRLGLDELRGIEAAHRRSGLRRYAVLVVRTGDEEALFRPSGVSLRELSARIEPFLR